MFCIRCPSQRRVFEHMSFQIDDHRSLSQIDVGRDAYSQDSNDQHPDSRDTQYTKWEDMIHLESTKQEDELASENAMAMERGEEIAEVERSSLSSRLFCPDGKLSSVKYGYQLSHHGLYVWPQTPLATNMGGNMVLNASAGPFWHYFNRQPRKKYFIDKHDQVRGRIDVPSNYPWLMAYRRRPSSWLSCMPIAHAHAISSERYHPLVVPFKFEFWKVRAPWPPFFEMPSLLDWPFSEIPSLLDLPIFETRIFGFFSRKLRKLVKLCGKIIYNFKPWSYGWGE